MKRLWGYAGCLCALFLAWKGLSAVTPGGVLTSPEAALSAFAAALEDPVFWGHFARSAFRVASAMLLAFAVAFPGGILMGRSAGADRWLAPFVFLTYPVPKIVLLPVVLILLGLGDASKIFMIALIAGYQILVAVRDGVKSLDAKYVDSLRSMGGGQRDVLAHVIVPAALPFAFTALRIGTGAGIAVLFFVESFATSAGLGYLIMDAWGRFDYPAMFTGILGMSLLGVCMYELFNLLERRLCAWKRAGEPGPKRSGLLKTALTYGEMIKFSHTVFALPFALSAVVLASREVSIPVSSFFWILTAMVGARSAAMGFNRIADARIDRINPRTADRHIPAGSVSMAAAAGFVLLSSAVFVLSAAMLSPLCLNLSVPVLLALFAYSYTKRFTLLSHFYLGLSISMAPLGAWIAVTGGFDPAVLTLCAALFTYIAGFDIIYACQDTAFDRAAGLHSIPAKLGNRAALRISTAVHAVSFACFASVWFAFSLGPVYLAALLIIGALLVVEHRLVKPDDLSRINIAFFHANSAVSIVLFLGIFIDRLVG